MGSNFKKFEAILKNLETRGLKIVFFIFNSTAIESRPLLYKLNCNFLKTIPEPSAFFCLQLELVGYSLIFELVGYSLTLNQCCETGAYAIRAPR